MAITSGCITALSWIIASTETIRMMAMLATVPDGRSRRLWLSPMLSPALASATNG